MEDLAFVLFIAVFAGLFTNIVMKLREGAKDADKRSNEPCKLHSWQYVGQVLVCSVCSKTPSEAAQYESPTDDVY
jgi:H+/Cl- antiporter ClcA